jgi:hypothetical protein
MNYGPTATYNDSAFLMLPQFFQPLPVLAPCAAHVSAGQVVGSVAAAGRRSVRGLSNHSFTIRGGFMNCTGGERRLIIAGKIFRRQGA